MKSAFKWLAWVAIAAVLGYGAWTYGVSPYFTQTTCPACAGKGEMLGELPGMGTIIKPTKATIPCKWCGGGGRVSLHQAEVIKEQLDKAPAR